MPDVDFDPCDRCGAKRIGWLFRTYWPKLKAWVCPSCLQNLKDEDGQKRT